MQQCGPGTLSGVAPERQSYDPEGRPPYWQVHGLTMVRVRSLIRVESSAQAIPDVHRMCITALSIDLFTIVTNPTGGSHETEVSDCL